MEAYNADSLLVKLANIHTNYINLIQKYINYLDVVWERGEENADKR